MASTRYIVEVEMRTVGDFDRANRRNVDSMQKFERYRALRSMGRGASPSDF